MVGTNPYIVVALRRRSGRCTVCPCCLLPVPCAVCASVLLCSVCTLLRHQCVRACCCAVRASCCVCSARALLRRPVRARCCVVRACCCDGSARVLLRLQCVGAAAASAVRGLSVGACCCLGRPPARFVEFGRLYPGGWKQWSAPTPTMSWHCAVGSAGRYGRPRPVSSISDVYTQEVGNNGRDQPQPCCGVATSARLVHGLIALGAAYSVARCCDVRACVLLRLPCVQLRLPCVRAAASAVRACCCVGRA